MQPSSLIFVLVVAIWAVYLLQYWIKRRDHLSTVRSVDRFSAAIADPPARTGAVRVGEWAATARAVEDVVLAAAGPTGT